MIQTEHLSKTYRNGFKAVKDLNLHVNKGDIFGFLGPNGAGKTTTIRMLDGLLEPTAGQVFIDGMDVNKQALEIKRLIGVVPESHGYYDWMTAKEYLQYFNSLFGGNEGDVYLEELLKKVGLREKKNVPVGEFSRGMKQRLGIAKALVNHPKIIFLDEPTLGLDPSGQRDIQQLIREINLNDGITVFITSHLLKDIEVLCNKVSIIKDGILVEQGSIKELQGRYVTAYTILLQTNDNDLALSLIQRLDGISDVSKGERQLVVRLSEGLDANEISTVKRNLAGTVFTAGIDIREMTHKTLSMEDIFFKVTESSQIGREAVL
ncbi:ABC transporter ATP-binding protein [Lachnoclostridium phytofermentans]|uniref:ABC transporter related n=1 Tax=Lachnoclostridium phytofermentans (strain ATCC 700394 / DSM 18823 / ISDg) TaxID=357809 RepID=A9KPU3_LACP7|nr:ABC transporter ATP-binding protein [Lachnoclostridium phytofermentans]ABX41842.1 ABC transporter related [Lachnoclostridium phytofermentans ISDg]